MKANISMQYHMEIRTAFKTVLIKIYKVTDSLIFSIFTWKPQKFESGT